MKIINNQLNIKLGQFTQVEYDAVLKKRKKTQNLPSQSKTCGSMEDNEIWWHTAPIVQCRI